MGGQWPRGPRLLAPTGNIGGPQPHDRVVPKASNTHTVVASTSWEKQNGILPLIAAAPANIGTVFAGRSIQWIVDGLSVGLVSMFGLGALFGIRYSAVQIAVIAALLLLTTFSVYCFGLALAAVTLYSVNIRSIVANVSGLTLLIVSGAVIPVDFWPAWVGTVAKELPLTHGLAAIRSMRESAFADVALNGLLEFLVAVTWLVISYVLFNLYLARAKRTGSIEFSQQ